MQDKRSQSAPQFGPTSPLRPSISSNPPLGLYIHIPWCVRKCPYCDFNSHEQRGTLPFSDYRNALINDLQQDTWMAQGRSIDSIFFGGGTPSLMPNTDIAKILSRVDQLVGISSDAEITMEANPGTVEHHDFSQLRTAGVNRLSLGVQSFNPEHLQRLGRIHTPQDAIIALDRARKGGFDNINIDLMHGLPDQSLEQALADIEHAIALQPQHISWYQLTIEKNTEFYSRPPTLPAEERLLDIYEHGHRRLTHSGFNQYEISAYTQNNRPSTHNLNYWQFGDYLAIGAGAHGKITQREKNEIFRYHKTRTPKDYLDPDKAFTVSTDTIDDTNLVVEFMMNALRLNAGVTTALFHQRTGLSNESIRANITHLKRRGLLDPTHDAIVPSVLGRRFLNNVLEAFVV